MLALINEIINLIGDQFGAVVVLTLLACLLVFSWSYFIRLRPADQYKGQTPLARQLRDEYKTYHDSLAPGKNPLSQMYERWLGALLYRFDQVLNGPESIEGKNKSAQWDKYWSGTALNRLLLIALIYPLGMITLIWFITGVTGPVETGLLFKADTSGLRRAFGGWIGALCLCLYVYFAKKMIVHASDRSDHLRPERATVTAAATAAAIAIAVALAFAGAGAIAGAIAGAGAIAFAVAFAASVAFAFAFAFALSVAGAVAAAFAGAVAAAVAYVGVVSVAGLVAGAFALVAILAVTATLAHFLQFLKGQGRVHFYRWGLAAWCFGALLFLVLIAWFLPPSANENGSSLLLILVFCVLPVLNALFDWASLGLTRLLLQLGLERKKLWPVFFSLIDLMIAVYVLVCLICVSIAYIHVFNVLAGIEVFDLKYLLNLMETDPTHTSLWWVYVTVFTTMLPSVFNIALGGLALVNSALQLGARVPQNLLPSNPAMLTPYTRSLAAGMITARVVFGGMVMIAVLFLIAALIVYVSPIFFGALIEISWNTIHGLENLPPIKSLIPFWN